MKKELIFRVKKEDFDIQEFCSGAMAVKTKIRDTQG